MTIDQIIAVLEKRAEAFAEKVKTDIPGGMRGYYTGQEKACRDAISLLELLDGESGPCPKCGSSMGSRLPDGSWQCNGLSSYAVLASELCGLVTPPTTHED